METNESIKHHDIYTEVWHLFLKSIKDKNGVD